MFALYLFPSPLLLSFYLPYATSPPRDARQPTRCTFILSHLPLQLRIVALFLGRVSSVFLLPALRFRFPRRRSTTSRRSYVLWYYAYFTDFYGIPRGLLSGPLLPGLLGFLLALSLFRLRTYFLLPFFFIFLFAYLFFSNFSFCFPFSLSALHFYFVVMSLLNCNTAVCFIHFTVLSEIS